MTYRARKTPAMIFIVDDHPLVREGLAARIAAQDDMEVCGDAADTTEALAALRTTHADLVIVDLSLRSGHGIELIKQIRARDSRIKTLVVSAYDESLFAERCLRAGALGYINKQEVQENVIQAIRTVLNGQRYLSTQMTQRLIGQAVGSPNAASGDPVAQLTDRELEVFQLIGKGLTTGAIAKRLCLSVHTIDSHREKLRNKLKLKNSAELMQHAVQWMLENGT